MYNIKYKDMDAITFTDLRQNLKSFLDRVYYGREPIIITRQQRKNVVLLSIDDYNSMVETHYLLSSPANAKRLRESVKQLGSGKAKKRKLIE